MIIDVEFEMIVNDKMVINYTWSGNGRLLGETFFVYRDEMITINTGVKLDGVNVFEEEMFTRLAELIPETLDDDTEVYVSLHIQKSVTPTVAEDIQHFVERLNFNGIYALVVRII